jgi:hypothetical protein
LEVVVNGIENAAIGDGDLEVFLTPAIARELAEKILLVVKDIEGA